MQDISKPIPLDVYLQQSTTRTTTYNQWYPRIKQWSLQYIRLAKDQIAMRNFELSQQLSKQGKIWAQRAEMIEQHTNAHAQARVAQWIVDDPLPDLPKPFAYFKALKAFEDLQQTHKRLAAFNQPICLIEKNVPIVQARAHFELALGLYQQKQYDQAYQQNQLALAPILVVDMTKPLCDNKTSIE
jgi:hypothetical protein